MDPISAISFVSAIAGIVDVIAKGVISLSDLQSRYRIADLKVSLLIGQLSTLKAALTQVGHLVEDLSHAPRDRQLVSDLSQSLLSLEMIIGALDNRLSHLQRNSEDGLSNWGKVGFIWDEQTMSDYLKLLDHQVNALGLLLSALQCRTTLEQSNILRATDSRLILDRARDESSSLIWLLDSDSIAATLQSVGTEDLETIHTRFDFDSEVFTSRAYQVATRANMIDALMGSKRNGISHSTEITGGLPGDASDLTGSGQPTHAGIALTTVVDVDSDPASLSLSDLSLDNATEAPASPKSLSRPRDSDAQLPDFPIHTLETLGSLALQLGKLPSKRQILPPLPTQLLPTTKSEPRGALLKPSTRLSLLRRPKQQVEVPQIAMPEDAVPLAVQRFHVYKPVKILILGSSETGKSTLAKTMRAGHGDVDESWQRLYRETIINNTVLSLKWLVFAAQQAQYETDIWQRSGAWDTEAFSTNALIIDELGCDGSSITYSLATITSAAQYMWSHPYIREVFQTSSTEKLPGNPRDLPLYLPDCAEHFLNSIGRIFKEDYLPSLEDVIWAQILTTGIWESKFIVNGTEYQVFDLGGARPERRKWPLSLFDVNMVVFTIDVSCYHQVVNEDNVTNRMKEQFTLWESAANSDWFIGPRITVLFTKEDKLTPERLKRHPFEEEFPDYTGDPESANDIIKYITWRLDGLLNRQADDRSRNVTFFRTGTSICESVKVWEKLLSVK